MISKAYRIKGDEKEEEGREVRQMRRGGSDGSDSKVQPLCGWSLFST